MGSIRFVTGLLLLLLISSLVCWESTAQEGTRTKAPRPRRGWRWKKRHPQTSAPTSTPTEAPVEELPNNAEEYETAPSLGEPSQPPSIDPANPDVNTVAGAKADFKIEFLYDKVDSKFQTAFELAKARWSSIIVGDLPSEIDLIPGDWCGFSIQDDRTVDDLVIGVRISNIDGVGGILGRAGPCALDDNGVPRFGVMEFDSADVERMVTQGSFNNVILHEMGHVLGLGTLWDMFDLIDGRAPPSLYYDGEEGNLGNAAVGRTGRAFIEDYGGPGTAWSHWKEAPPLGYDSELMTGWVEPEGVKMPLSALTVRALRDIGYETDLSKADPYTAPPWPPATPSQGRRMLRDFERKLKNKVPMVGDTLKRPFKHIKSKPKAGREKEFEKQKEKFKDRRRKLASLIEGQR